jgi:general nucleoside transport system ATP-binding protein
MADADPPGGQPLLALQGIVKAYAGLRALDGVGLTVRAGEIHAVLGENGAGKSTLMKLICGVVQPDAGRIAWEGQPVRFASPVEARRRGIAMVFQHFALFEQASVVENVALALPGRLALRQRAEQLAELARRYGLPLNPWQPVHALSVGERQRVEIVRCLMQSPRLLILDEPTAVLTPQAVGQLFDTLRRLREEGTAILYVSHKLEEIRRLCDRATIIRQGRVVGEADPRRETESDLAQMMIGRAFPRTERRPRREGAVALEVDALSAPAQGPFGTALHAVSFQVRAGEILGLAGISGNGQAELLARLLGTRPSAPQAVRLAGAPVGHLGAAARRARGLAFVPEERLGVGAVPPMSLTQNMLLTAYQQGLVRSGLIRRRWVQAAAARCIGQFDVRCSGPGADAASLSGGNLQKFIVGREIGQDPAVLVAAQPTWGVDVAATALIRQRIMDLAERGAAVLLVSEDLGEIIEVCDRVAVIAGGRVSPLRAVHEVDAAQIGRWMAGGFPDADRPALEPAR